MESSNKVKVRTVKQKRFIKEYIKSGGNGTKAAMVAYPGTTYSSAASIATRNLEKLDIATIFDNAGLTDEAIATTLNEARSATRDNGKPDWLPRLKASEMALKVRGHFKERIEHMGSVGVYPILGGLTKKEDKGAIEGVVVSDNVDK